LASATLDANQLKQYYVSAAKECVADAVISAVWDTAAKFNFWSDAINTALFPSTSSAVWRFAEPPLL
jgi:hypothetical protein